MTTPLPEWVTDRISALCAALELRGYRGVSAAWTADTVRLQCWWPVRQIDYQLQQLMPSAWPMSYEVPLDEVREGDVEQIADRIRGNVASPFDALFQVRAPREE